QPPKPVLRWRHGTGERSAPRRRARRHRRAAAVAAVSKADNWKFRGAVYGAMQGHAKPLAQLLELLRAGHPRTVEDEQALDAFVRQLRTSEKGAPGRKETPRAFTHTANVRAAIELAMLVQERGAKRGDKLTRKAAAAAVAGPAVWWRNRAALPGDMPEKDA